MLGALRTLALVNRPLLFYLWRVGGLYVELAATLGIYPIQPSEEVFSDNVLVNGTSYYLNTRGQRACKNRVVKHI